VRRTATWGRLTSSQSLCAFIARPIMHYYTKFQQNCTIPGWVYFNIHITQRPAPETSTNTESTDSVSMVVTWLLLSNQRQHLQQMLKKMPKNSSFRFRGHPPSWIWPEENFDHSAAFPDPRCISVPYFNKIEQCKADYWRFDKQVILGTIKLGEDT